jgi:hypothetical protein
MKFQKGKPKTGGKVKGTKNSITKTSQAFWQNILDQNASHIQHALDDVRIQNPADYLKIVISLTEFVMPKLARTELKHELPADKDFSLNVS